MTIILNNKNELYSSVSIPSVVHSYSLGVDYIKQWFLSKFNKDYFKVVHVDGKQVLDDFRKFDNTKSLKTLKPSVAILPQLQFDFDRDKIDSYPFGLKQYMKRSDLEKAFFKDTEMNMYLGLAMEQIQINFTFRVRVSTRAQQIDLYKFMQMAFRIGFTQGEYVDMDFHIPYSLVMQVAKDAGFDIIDDQVVNTIDFVKYLNSKSSIPVLFKFRAINGKSEYFLRFKEMYTHISCLDTMSADDGERTGMLSDNFMIEFNVQLQIPAPKLYIYYSKQQHDTLQKLEIATSGLGLFGIKLPSIPEQNSKGWDLYLTTEFYEDNNSNKSVIDFKELFTIDSEIGKIIQYEKSILISPAIFLDFKLYNCGKEIGYKMNWESLMLTTDEPIKDSIINIMIYTDVQFMRKEMENIEQIKG